MGLHSPLRRRNPLHGVDLLSRRTAGRSQQRQRSPVYGLPASRGDGLPGRGCLERGCAPAGEGHQENAEEKKRRPFFDGRMIPPALPGLPARPLNLRICKNPGLKHDGSGGYNSQESIFFSKGVGHGERQLRQTCSVVHQPRTSGALTISLMSGACRA